MRVCEHWIRQYLKNIALIKYLKILGIIG
jgi:hypothetical protein